MKLTQVFMLLRPEQYYKNLVIFLALYFSGNFLDSEMLGLTILGFVTLCLVSSANYIVNDIVDRKKDKHHKEKAIRPIANGTISSGQGAVIAIIFFGIGLGLAYALSLKFFFALTALIFSSTTYSLLLRNELFMDILVIAINFVIRAVSGAFLLSVWVSPWLLIGTFLLALFLATGKRKAERIFLKKETRQHRPLLESYSDEHLNFLLQQRGILHKKNQ